MRGILFKTLLFLFLLTSLSQFSFAQNTSELQGITITGIKGIDKSLSEVIRHGREHPVPDNVKVPLKPEMEGPTPLKQDPEAKSVSKFGSAVTGSTTTATTTASTQPNFSNFLAIWGSYATVSGRESPYTPPDNCGDVGTTQVIATANCRMKVFNKPSVTGTPATTPTGSSTTTLPSVLNVDLNSFFSNSSLGITGISDPHVRFDRLSGRWFIVAIDVNHNTNNYCCVGVSDGPTLTAASNFKIYYFNISQTGGSSRDFFDYPTLGVDKNSLYIGGNMFKSGRTFSGCNMWVINKANLISGTLTVTSFPYSITQTNMYTPQGVHNDDPGATYGYFIGASQTVYSRLNIRRVSYSGGTPTLSADLALATSTTYTPKTAPTLGGVAIDGGDRRLFAAMIKKNKITGVANLWVAQGTLLNSSGIGGSGGDRDGALWMEIGNLSSTPSIIQGATLYDGVNSSSSSAINYIYPTIALSGQGHSIMGFTSAGSQKYAQAAVAGRYRTDAAATFKSPADFTTSTSTYNPGANRWGDYTQTVVDPVDDMTMWTFSEYAATKDAWGVRAAQLKAPPPATPVLASTPAYGTSTVTINGTSNNNSEFFDPGNDAGGPGFSHINVAVKGPGAVTVSNVTFVNPIQIKADFTVGSNSPGTYTVIVTNPDGQKDSTTFTLAARPLITSNTDKISAPYPNPTSSIVNFTLFSKNQQKANMEIIDIAGRTIKSESIELNAGMNQKRIALSGMTSGSYIFEFKDQQNNIIQRATVIKK